MFLMTNNLGECCHYGFITVNCITYPKSYLTLFNNTLRPSSKCTRNNLVWPHSLGLNMLLGEARWHWPRLGPWGKKRIPLLVIMLHSLIQTH